MLFGSHLLIGFAAGLAAFGQMPPTPLPVPMDAGLTGVIGPIFTLIMMIVSGFFTLRGNATVTELRIAVASANMAAAQAAEALAANRLELAVARKELADARKEMEDIRGRLDESDRELIQTKSRLAHAEDGLKSCQEERAELVRLRLVVERASGLAGK